MTLEELQLPSRLRNLLIRLFEQQQTLALRDLHALREREGEPRVWVTLAVWRHLTVVFPSGVDPLDELLSLHGRLSILSSAGEEERVRSLQALAAFWARGWRLHGDAKVAAQASVREEEMTLASVKQEMLKPAILEALHEARSPQVTRISRDRAWGRGSRLILVQKRNLEKLFRGEDPERLREKLRKLPAGLRVLPSGEMIGPIEGAFLGLDPEVTTPLHLRPTLFVRWVRRRARHRAHECLLVDSSLGAEGVRRDLARAKRVEEQGKYASEGDRKGAERAQKGITALNALREESQANLEWLDPERGAQMRIAIQRLLGSCTESEREKVSQLLRLLRDDGCSIAEAKNLLADQLGISRGAVDVTFHRMRERYEDPL